MRAGHRAAQRMFEELGRSQGFMPRRTFSATLPTDGVWFHHRGFIESLPVVAIEVVASETQKVMKGSIHTLELVSPALGVLLIEDEEIWRKRIRNGATEAQAASYVAHLIDTASALVKRSRQRIEVWTVSHLRKLHAIAGKRRH